MGEIKKNFLICGHVTSKKFSPERCAGNKAIFSFGLDFLFIPPILPSLIQLAYKDWLCSSTRFAYSLNGDSIGPCKATADAVCLHCPSFNPEYTYGGFMAFQCDDAANDHGKLLSILSTLMV